MTTNLTCFLFNLYVCHRRSGPGKQHRCRSQPNLWDRLPQVRAFHPRTSQKKILVRDPKRFKGMAFTLEERQTLGIHGLLPARIKTLDEQVQLYLQPYWNYHHFDSPFQAENCMRNLRRYTDPLNQYMYLVSTCSYLTRVPGVVPFGNRWMYSVHL